jgi:uncharacterized protein YbjT (DUF2867 family)
MAAFVVIGGTGQIGAKTVARLRARGLDALAASPRTGVDTLSGHGLDPALTGASVVIDVSKPHTHDAGPARRFFTAATTRLMHAERAHGIKHHIGLSIVGSDRPHDIPFYRAKAVGEQIVRDAGVPWTLVHATQFFEFAPAIAASAEIGEEVLLPDALVQPASGADVADVLVEVALDAALDEDIEIAGPEQMPLADFITRALRARGDARTVRPDPAGLYFGGHLETDTLLPRAGARILPTRFSDWMLASTEERARG